MSKTYLWLDNIEKDFYKLVHIPWETFTTTQRLTKLARHVTTSDLHVFRGLKHGMGGWLLVTCTIYLPCKINCYFPHIFPAQQKNFSSYWRIFQIIPYHTSHPKDRVVNVCKHKFAFTNVTPKRRNGAHFITHAPHCAWVMIIEVLWALVRHARHRQFQT